MCSVSVLVLADLPPGIAAISDFVGEVQVAEKIRLEKAVLSARE